MTEQPDLSALMTPIDYAALVPATLLDAGPVAVLPGAISHLQLVYAAPLGWRPLRLDLHLPADRDGSPVPVVVYVHGGSFVAGMPAMGPWQDLVARGIAVVAISYRFANEVTFPEPVEDVRAALRWTVDNAEHYGLDAGRLALWGSSAGAYLASVAAVAGSAELGRRIGTSDARPHVSAVVCHYGIFVPAELLQDATSGAEPQTESLLAILAMFFGGARAPAVYDLIGADPVPPFRLVHGDDDHRVGHGQSVRMHEALTSHGVPSEIDIVPGGDHGSAHFESRAEVDAVEEFLRRSWAGAAR